MDCEIPDDRAAVAEYVSDMTAELAVLAAWAEYADLARILEMARLESERLCGRPPNTGEAAIDAAPAPQEPDRSQSANVILLSALRAARR